MHRNNLPAMLLTVTARRSLRARGDGPRSRGADLGERHGVAAAGEQRRVTHQRVAVTFDRSMDSASCAGRFTLRAGDSSGAMVPGRMTWDTTYHNMTFLPDSMMAPGTTYFVRMRDSMMTHDSMMSGGSMGSGGMGGGGMMGGTGSGQHLMPGSPMMFDQPPAGATRTSNGMMWSFTTGS